MGTDSNVSVPCFLLRVADGKHGVVMIGLTFVQIVNIGEYVLSAMKADASRRHQHWVLVPIAVDNLITKADGRVVLVIK